MCSPRIRVAAVIPDGDGIILVRHEKDGRIYHLLPGGGVEPGESLETALLREIREETGLECRIGAPLFLSDSIAPDGSRHVVQLTFLAGVLGESPSGATRDERVVGVETVPLATLGALDLRPPMADELMRAATSGFAAPALYLGPLWSESDNGMTETDAIPVADR